MNYSKIAEGLYTCHLCGEVGTAREIVTHTCAPSYIECPYCSEFVHPTLIDHHLWNKHKAKEIEESIKRIDSFLVSVSKGFIIRYRISVPEEDVVQFLRINIYETLENKYIPSDRPLNCTADPPTDRFAKACCSRFLKRYIQTYHYKRNSMNVNPIRLDDEKSYVRKEHVGGTAMNDSEYQAFLDSIFHLMSSQEAEILAYLVDDPKYFTQAKIADLVGISQPMVSYHVKRIRKKVIRLINQK